MSEKTLPAAVGSSAELGLVVGRAYPATAAAPMQLSPVTTATIGVQLQRAYTQAELDAAVAAEREWTLKKCIALIDTIDDGEQPAYRHCQEAIAGMRA